MEIHITLQFTRVPKCVCLKLPVSSKKSHRRPRGRAPGAGDTQLVRRLRGGGVRPSALRGRDRPGPAFAPVQGGGRFVVSESGHYLYQAGVLLFWGWWFFYAVVRVSGMVNSLILFKTLSGKQYISDVIRLERFFSLRKKWSPYTLVGRGKDSKRIQIHKQTNISEYARMSWRRNCVRRVL